MGGIAMGIPYGDGAREPLGAGQNGSHAPTLTAAPSRGRPGTTKAPGICRGPSYDA